MKILYGYPYFPSVQYDNVEKLCLETVMQLQKSGIDVDPFCLSISPPSNPISFERLDRLWTLNDKKLMLFYEHLYHLCEGYDVFFNSPGINLHPEFVKLLPCFTVFGCNDDPEASEALSRPVATAYDMHCIWGQRDGGLDGPLLKMFPFLNRIPSIFVSNSTAGLEFLNIFAPDGRVFHIQNAVLLAPPKMSRSQWRQKFNIDSDALVFLKIATLSCHKAHNILLESWALAQRNPLFPSSARLVLAGRPTAHAQTEVRRYRDIRVFHPSPRDALPPRQKVASYAAGRMYLLKKHKFPLWFVLVNVLYPLCLAPVEALRYGCAHGAQYGLIAAR